MSAPPQARDFLRALGSAAPGTAQRSTSPASSTSGAASPPPTPRTTTMSTTDDDLRARVVDIQQSVDRMLADTTPSTVGTTGANPSATTATDASARSNTVSVDRARLMQLRQQLDALLVSLNRR
jgi:hypothetical protein